MGILLRNDMCWCGSGKKYKHCHMDNDDELIKKGCIMPPREIIKTREQIEGIRKSGVLTRKILDMVAERIKLGITTNQINDWVYEYTVQNGGYPAPLNYNGYPKSICTSINNVICHGIPNETVLKNGDIINIDVSTILDGYYSDSSRMFKIGEVSAVADKLVECASTCLKLGIDAVKPYESISDIGRAIEPYAKSQGYSVVRDFGGHGIGIEFHEDPFISHYAPNTDEMIMLPGMVFTVEPMINEGRKNCRILSNGWTTVTIDRSLSAQWEHTVVVTSEGVELLTQ
jgi:methionyl aminopeptidase